MAHLVPQESRAQREANRQKRDAENGGGNAGGGNNGGNRSSNNNGGGDYKPPPRIIVCLAAVTAEKDGKEHNDGDPYILCGGKHGYTPFPGSITNGKVMITAPWSYCNAYFALAQTNDPTTQKGTRWYYVPILGKQCIAPVFQQTLAVLGGLTGETRQEMIDDLKAMRDKFVARLTLEKTCDKQVMAIYDRRAPMAKHECAA